MSSNRKDNTGYHLKNIFVGAEGTLGFITKVSLSCPTLPRYKNAAFLACHTFGNVQNVLQAAKTELGEILSAFEFMDPTIIGLLSEKFVIPISYKEQDIENYYVLVETQGSHSEHDSDKMNNFLSLCLKLGYIEDGVCAQNNEQLKEMCVCDHSKFRRHFLIPSLHFHFISTKVEDS
jgi:FAD/FMN-containing dehydrogenase